MPEGLLFDKPVCLSPVQKWMMLSNAKINFYGSRRGGCKTFAAIGMLMKRASDWPGYRAGFIRSTFKEFRNSILPDLKAWNECFGMPATITGEHGNDPKVTWKDGSEILFYAMDHTDDVSKARGANLVDIVIDEAQKVKSEILSQLVAEMRGPVGAYPRHLYYLSNPGGCSQMWLKNTFIVPAKELAPHGNIKHPEYLNELTGQEEWINPISKRVSVLQDHWRYEEEVVLPSGGTYKVSKEVVLVPPDQNPGMDEDEYLAGIMASGISEDSLKQQVYNDWDVVAGQYYPRLHRAIGSGFYPGPYDRILCAIDHGWRKTAVVWAYVDDRGVYRVFDCEIYPEMDIPVKVPLIKARHPHTSLYIIDPAARQHLEGSGSRTIRKNYVRAGLDPLVYCKSNDRVAGWESLRTGFDNGKLQIDKKCDLLLDSLASLESKDVNGVVTEDCEKTDYDHPSDALRYLYVNGFYIGDKEPDELAQMIAEDPFLQESLDQAQGYYRR